MPQSVRAVTDPLEQILNTLDPQTAMIIRNSLAQAQSQQQASQGQANTQQNRLDQFLGMGAPSQAAMDPQKAFLIAEYDKAIQRGDTRSAAQMQEAISKLTMQQQPQRQAQPQSNEAQISEQLRQAVSNLYGQSEQDIIRRFLEQQGNLTATQDQLRQQQEGLLGASEQSRQALYDSLVQDLRNQQVGGTQELRGLLASRAGTQQQGYDAMRQSILNSLLGQEQRQGGLEAGLRQGVSGSLNDLQSQLQAILGASEASQRGAYGQNTQAQRQAFDALNQTLSSQYVPELQRLQQESMAAQRGAFDRYAQGELSRLPPEIEAGLASRGFEAGGGAFAAALANARLGLEGQRFGLEQQLAQGQQSIGERLAQARLGMAQQGFGLEQGLAQQGFGLEQQLAQERQGASLQNAMQEAAVRQALEEALFGSGQATSANRFNIESQLAQGQQGLTSQLSDTQLQALMQDLASRQQQSAGLSQAGYEQGMGSVQQRLEQMLGLRGQEAAQNLALQQERLGSLLGNTQNQLQSQLAVNQNQAQMQREDFITQNQRQFESILNQLGLANTAQQNYQNISNQFQYQQPLAQLEAQRQREYQQQVFEEQKRQFQATQAARQAELDAQRKAEFQNMIGKGIGSVIEKPFSGVLDRLLLGNNQPVNPYSVYGILPGMTGPTPVSTVPSYDWRAPTAQESFFQQQKKNPWAMRPNWLY